MECWLWIFLQERHMLGLFPENSRAAQVTKRPENISEYNVDIITCTCIILYLVNYYRSSKFPIVHSITSVCIFYISIALMASSIYN